MRNSWEYTAFTEGPNQKGTYLIVIFGTSILNSYQVTSYHMSYCKAPGHLRDIPFAENNNPTK